MMCSLPSEVLRAVGSKKSKKQNVTHNSTHWYVQDLWYDLTLTQLMDILYSYIQSSLTRYLYCPLSEWPQLCVSGHTLILIMGCLGTFSLCHDSCVFSCCEQPGCKISTTPPRLFRNPLSGDCQVVSHVCTKLWVRLSNGRTDLNLLSLLKWSISSKRDNRKLMSPLNLAASEREKNKKCFLQTQTPVSLFKISLSGIMCKHETTLVLHFPSGIHSYSHVFLLPRGYFWVSLQEELDSLRYIIQQTVMQQALKIGMYVYNIC